MVVYDDVAAEVFLDTKIDQLMKLINEKYEPFKEDSIHRQMVDLIKAMRLLRILTKKLKIKLGIDAVPYIITYLQT